MTVTENEAGAARREVTPSRAEQASADLYRVAYDQSLRALDDQLDELSGIRGRASAYMAFIGSATAFLVGTGLKATHRDALFYGFALPASVATLVALVTLGLLLRPIAGWENRMSATVLIDKWIDREVPGPSLADLLKNLALRQDRSRGNNEARLVRIRALYLGVVGSGGLGIVLWSALVWLRA